jgi:hypothetical protein
MAQELLDDLLNFKVPPEKIIDWLTTDNFNVSFEITFFIYLSIIISGYVIFLCLLKYICNNIGYKF